MVVLLDLLRVGILFIQNKKVQINFLNLIMSQPIIDKQSRPLYSQEIRDKWTSKIP